MKQEFLPERVESFIEAIEKAKSLEEIYAALKNRLSDLGFEYFSYWLYHPKSLSGPLCLTNYPSDWAEYYLDRGFGSHDYTSRHAVQTRIPFCWDALPKIYNLTANQQIVFKEGIDAGIRSGGTFPIVGLLGEHASLSIACNMRSEDFKQLFRARQHEVYIMTTFVHDRIMTMKLQSRELEHIKLSAREVEIMTWMALGKSTWETATIVGLSEPSVKECLTKVRAKFNTANTTQAIALAVFNGVISPGTPGTILGMSTLRT